MRSWLKGAGAPHVLFAGAAALFVLAAAAIYAAGARSFDEMGRETRAAADIASASRAILEIPIAVLSLLEFDDNVEAGRQAPVLFLDATREARNALDRAQRLAPDHAPEIEAFRRRLESLVDKARAPLAIGNATSGLTRAAQLNPTDLTELAAGAHLAAAPSVGFQALARDVGAFGTAVSAEAIRGSNALERRIDAALLVLAAVGLAALFAARAAGRMGLAREFVARRAERRRLGPADRVSPPLSPGTGASLACLAEPLPALPRSLRDPQAWARGGSARSEPL